MLVVLSPTQPANQPNERTKPINHPTSSSSSSSSSSSLLLLYVLSCCGNAWGRFGTPVVAAANAAAMASAYTTTQQHNNNTTNNKKTNKPEQATTKGSCLWSDCALPNRQTIPNTRIHTRCSRMCDAQRTNDERTNNAFHDENASQYQHEHDAKNA